MDRKPIIYISKSKQGNIDDLMMVKKILSRFDVEITEFKGGRYTSKALLTSDIMLLIPPKLPKAFNYNITVGKGQYEEAILAMDSDIPTYYVLAIGDEIYVSQDIEDIDEAQEDDWTNYATIWCEESLRELQFYEKLKECKSPTTSEKQKEITTNNLKQNKTTLLICLKL